MKNIKKQHEKAINKGWFENKQKKTQQADLVFPASCSLPILTEYYKDEYTKIMIL